MNDGAVLLLVRFSWLGSSARFYRDAGADMTSRRSALFEPRRLARRLLLFRWVCLPSLIAQPPDKAAAIVMVSDALPEAVRGALDDLLAPHSHLRAVAMPPMDHHADAFARIHGPAPARRITVRLDDDDAVAADLTERLLDWATPAHEGGVVTPYRGWRVSLGADAVEVWPQNWAMGSAGLALISSKGDGRNVYHCGNHVTVDRRFPVRRDERPDAFLRTIHGGNDSDVAGERPSGTPIAAPPRQAFPHLTAERLRALARDLAAAPAS